MANIEIRKIRRGLAADRPTLTEGEFGLDTDTFGVWIGTSGGNKQVGAGEGTYRCNSVSLTANVPSAVLYSSVLTSGLLGVLRCYDVNGADVEVTLSAQTTAGFTATSPVNATLIYLVVKAL